MNHLPLSCSFLFFDPFGRPGLLFIGGFSSSSLILSSVFLLRLPLGRPGFLLGTSLLPAAALRPFSFFRSDSRIRPPSEVKSMASGHSMQKSLYMSFMAFVGTSVISLEVYAVHLRFLSTESDEPKTYPSLTIFMWIIFTTQVPLVDFRGR